MAYHDNTDTFWNNMYLPKEALFARMLGIRLWSINVKHEHCSMHGDILAALHESGKPFDEQN